MKESRLFLYTSVTDVREKFCKQKHLETAVFCVAATCSLVKLYQCFGSTCHLHHQGNDYMAQSPRRQPSTYSLASEPQNSIRINGLLVHCEYELEPGHSTPLLLHSRNIIGQKSLKMS